MINGDISNETSPRIIVVVDVVAETDLVENRKLFRSTTERKITKLNNQALAHLWMKADRFGLSVEMAGFADQGWEEEHLSYLMDKLDRRGGNPFNYAELYTSIEDFISELPYRSNLKGVIDLRSRVARYGSWGIELDNL